MPIVTLCTRCNSLVDGTAFVQTILAGQPINNQFLCVSCMAEHANFMATAPTWALPAPVVLPLQPGIPSKVG